jgi:hypothetical protein
MWKIEVVVEFVAPSRKLAEETVKDDERTQDRLVSEPRLESGIS